ncbi:ArnT family glycosyltransferase [Domibacillus indicus]|uniref:ArnT family glycosyltransferase n=1 Tax=Domibacillus indicus TaxID=1437523 RepID=UPI0006180A6D|nr:glycosyltransferase family 39 protein [Domibacillus indicus]
MKRMKMDGVLLCILLAALFLNGFNIWQDDAANQYYLAAVKSMTQSFHNFFYASFDPSGFVSVDKPPLALWIQTIFALVFGVHTWSVILPQVLAGAGSVWLLYSMIKPAFGRGAARAAALVMALTPIAAAVSRTNNIDSLLVFTLLAGTWCLMKAVNQNKMGWLLAAFGLVGLAFNMKMLQAFMAAPAFFVFYFIAAGGSWKRKLISLSLASAVLAGVSLSWALAVDSISPESRPYVGSSQTNSVLELAFGYNGTERLLGQETGLANAGGGGRPDGAAGAGNQRDGAGMRRPPDDDGAFMDGNGGRQGAPGGGMPGGGQSMNMYGTGEAGPLRLFQSALSGQISWMLPFALFGLLGMAVRSFRSRREHLQIKEMQETLFWTAWLVPAAAFFSVAGFFHHYYLIMLAPPIAALSGIGWYALNDLFKQQKDWTGWLLPAAVLAASMFQVYILSSYTEQIGIGWLYGIGLLGAGFAFALVISRGRSFHKQLAVMGICVLLLAPAYWSATPLLYGGNSVLPEAGPQLQTESGGGMFSSEVDEGLLAYLKENNTGEEFLFATLTTVTAAPYIIEAGESVMALGGFNGTDPILSVSGLQALVEEGKVKYFLLSGNNSGNSELVSWIEENGTKIPSDEYSGFEADTALQDLNGMRGGSSILYRID